MLHQIMKNMKILDCTLRDGGYYTNWDFDSILVKEYLSTINTLPIDYIEIGYRQPAKEEYMGEYAYLPMSTILQCKQYAPDKKLVVMLNLKDVSDESAATLVSSLAKHIALIRLATAPNDIEKAARVATIIKQFGLQVSVNIMYMSTWNDVPEFWVALPKLEGVADILCMVDSYGAVYPSDIAGIVERIRACVNIPLGFHGHDNQSLAFANTLEAIHAGCDVVDATVMGMGRGAGNLQTELLLTYLAKNDSRINLNQVVELRNLYEPLHAIYKWGTNLPYMISGVNSLPQKEIMTMLSQRRYSVASIVRKLQNRLKNHNGQSYQLLIQEPINRPILFVGGGASVAKHIAKIVDFLHIYDDIPVCFLSAKYLFLFDEIANPRYFCMIGNEGARVEKQKQHLKATDKFVVSEQGVADAYIPDFVQTRTYMIAMSEDRNEAPLALAIEVARLISQEKHIMLVGLDGYSSSKREDIYDMMRENQELFDTYKDEFRFQSFLPTEYKNIQKGSIYSELAK